MNPHIKFSENFEKAKSLQDVMLNNVTFSTIDENNFPVSRVLTIRKIEGEKLFFIVNENSPKVRHLDINGKHEILIYWPSINIQYRIRGEISFHKNEETKKIWSKKSINSKIMDNFHEDVKAQSDVIDGYEKIKREIQLIRDEGIEELEPPSGVTLMILKMNYVEQWTGSAKDRIHERLLFFKKDENWSKRVLVP